MNFIIVCIANAMICKTFLPDFQIAKPLLSGRMRESALDELNGMLDRDLNWRDNNVQMIGHYNELVKKVFSVGAVMEESFDKQL